MTIENQKTKLVVVGAGPGGYAAAFRAADLGMEVTLVDSEPNPGGVCLYRGCIPSKALLHVAKGMHEVDALRESGVEFGSPTIDFKKMQNWKQALVSNLTKGLGQLVSRRKLRYIQGQANFLDAHTLWVTPNQGNAIQLNFDHAILATGSRPALPDSWVMDSPHLLNSSSALNLEEIPDTLLVVGGGYIGLELGSVFATLGSRVTVIEMMDSFLPGVDADLVSPLQKKLGKLFHKIYLKTQVNELTEDPKGIRVSWDKGNFVEVFSKVLVAIGRRPNSSGLGLNATKVKIDKRGFVEVNKSMQTSEPHIFAIGDLVGEPMLAHKASHEGFVAVSAIAGKPYPFEPLAIPAVVFTDPEIAWCGLTENQAKEKGIKISVSKFPWVASGRAMTLGRTEGLTKLIFNPETEQILGVGIVGVGAGELISEGVVAIEMGATAGDLKHCIHPHPTMSETLMESAEVFFGQATHLYKPK